MWLALFTMFKQYFTAATVLGSALEHGCNAINNIAIVGDEASAALVDEARSNRAKQAIQLKSELKQVKATA